ncbi:MAG: LemA family protein [Clostridia bacterium]|jgi:LemA protein|nr:LemA family protein [Clostridia bacterium]
MATAIVIILLVALVIYIIYIFNKIIKASNLNLEAFSNVDIALKKRYDLIPNLEEVVKGYEEHEKATLENITEMRNKLSEKMTVSDRQKEEDKYSAIIKEVMVSVENYPTLRAGENFLKFQEALMKIEEEIEMARRYYNGTTRNYNSLIQTFPNNILSSILGYSKRLFFEVDLLTRQNVQIDFEDRRQNPR